MPGARARGQESRCSAVCAQDKPVVATVADSRGACTHTHTHRIAPKLTQHRKTTLTYTTATKARQTDTPNPAHPRPDRIDHSGWRRACSAARAQYHGPSFGWQANGVFKKPWTRFQVDTTAGSMFNGDQQAGRRRKSPSGPPAAATSSKGGWRTRTYKG